MEKLSITDRVQPHAGPSVPREETLLPTEKSSWDLEPFPCVDAVMLVRLTESQSGSEILKGEGIRHGNTLRAHSENKGATIGKKQRGSGFM